MEEYYCKDCKHHTKKLPIFKKHMTSPSHIKMSNIKCDKNTDYSQFKKMIYSCDNCSNIYMTDKSLENHKCKNILSLNKQSKQSNSDPLKKEIYELKLTIQNLEKELETKNSQLNKTLDIALYNSKTANISVNMLNHTEMNSFDEYSDNSDDTDDDCDQDDEEFQEFLKRLKHKVKEPCSNACDACDSYGSCDSSNESSSEEENMTKILVKNKKQKSRK